MSDVFLCVKSPNFPPNGQISLQMVKFPSKWSNFLPNGQTMSDVFLYVKSHNIPSKWSNFPPPNGQISREGASHIPRFFPL